MLVVVVAAAIFSAGCAGSTSQEGLADSDATSEGETQADAESTSEGETPSDPTSDSDTVTAPVGSEAPVGAEGTIVLRLEDGFYRLPADGSGDPTSLSAALDDISPGDDGWIASSRNGEWLIMDTERFGCEDWACLVVARSDLTETRVVQAADDLVHTQDWGAISDDGTLIIFTTDEGPNDLDQAVLHATGDGWSAPEMITGSSPYAFNERGRITPDGTTVVFDCGPSQYGQEGTGVCQISLGGGEIERLVAPEDGTDATSSNAARGGDIAPDGSLIFEADWGGTERLWQRLSDGTTTIHSGFDNDNSPCVLPDGSLASLWLAREGNTNGVHELKIHAADASTYEVLLPNVDVVDGSIHCSG